MPWSIGRAVPATGAWACTDTVNRARQDFHSFVRKLFETVSPGDKFSPNWSVEADAMSSCDVRRLTLSCRVLPLPP